MAGQSDLLRGDAVRYFTPEGSRLPRGLRARLLVRSAELAGYLVAGAAVDFADYRHRVGQIQGMDEAIDICKQLEKEEGN